MAKTEKGQPEKKDKDGVELALFGGVGSQQADLEALEQAKKLQNERGNYSAWQETGWFTGPDNRWRYEIDDSRAALKPGWRGSPVLSDVIEHEELERHYPGLLDKIDFNLYSPDDEVYGGNLGYKRVNPDTNRLEIGVRGDGSEKEVLDSLIHELQHSLQSEEGFSRGGNLSRMAVELGDGFQFRGEQQLQQRKLEQAKEASVSEQRIVKEYLNPFLDKIKENFPDAEMLQRLFGDGFTYESNGVKKVNDSAIASSIYFLNNSYDVPPEKISNWLGLPYEGEIKEKITNIVQNEEHGFPLKFFDGGRSTEKDDPSFGPLPKDPSLYDVGVTGYDRLTGEIMARKAGDRREMTSEERSQNFPLERTLPGQMQFLNLQGEEGPRYPHQQPRDFNKGGMVPLEEQMEMAFMADQKEQTDPVSGNEVPPGAKPEEVRDDVPANLSEGEFVVPAHVVRFVGANTLYKLIKQTEMAIAEMEAGGMMGEPAEGGPAPEAGMGAPAAGGPAPGGEMPLSPEELEFDDMPPPQAGARNFNQGGLAVAPGQDRLGYIDDTPVFNPSQIKMYKDRLGFIRVIPADADGNPMTSLSDELVEIPSASQSPAGATGQAGAAGQGSGLKEWEGGPHDPSTFGPDIRGATVDQSRRGLAELNAIPDEISKGFSAMPGLGPMGTVMGIGKNAAENAYSANVAEQEYGAKSFDALDAWAGGTMVDRLDNMITGILGLPEAIRNPQRELRDLDSTQAFGGFGGRSTDDIAFGGVPDGNNAGSFSGDIEGFGSADPAGGVSSPDSSFSGGQDRDDPEGSSFS